MNPEIYPLALFRAVRFIMMEGCIIMAMHKRDATRAENDVKLWFCWVSIGSFILVFWVLYIGEVIY